MNQNNALGESGCWYNIYEGLEEDEGISEVVCRTGMTHVSFKIRFEDKTLDELKTECDNLEVTYHNIMEQKNADHQVVWDALGYCGTMFLDWLAESKKYVLDETVSDNKTVRQIYIKGVKMVDDALTTK